jgi:hypothetical protein
MESDQNGNKNNKNDSYDIIPEAVTFKPNEHEFKEPLDFINSIRPIAEKYGICKIIPPKNWRPKFQIDMNTFKFRPRVQRLNELEVILFSYKLKSTFGLLNFFPNIVGEQ